MSGKGPDAFRTISEVADELDLPQHVLRFWETKFSQIRPLKRSSGRRFYRTEDVALIRSIRGMLYGQGYTIRGVQKLLKERGGRGLPGAVELVAEPAPQVAATDAFPDTPATRPVPLVNGDIEAAGDASGRAPEMAGQVRALLVELRDCARILGEARRG